MKIWLWCLVIAGIGSWRDLLCCTLLSSSPQQTNKQSLTAIQCNSWGLQSWKPPNSLEPWARGGIRRLSGRVAVFGSISNLLPEPQIQRPPPLCLTFEFVRPTGGGKRWENLCSINSRLGSSYRLTFCQVIHEVTWGFAKSLNYIPKRQCSVCCRSARC